MTVLALGLLVALSGVAPFCMPARTDMAMSCCATDGAPCVTSMARAGCCPQESSGQIPGPIITSARTAKPFDQERSFVPAALAADLDPARPVALAARIILTIHRSSAPPGDPVPLFLAGSGFLS
ncbi:MAG: hypothetical protein V3U86_05150 [Acidobacteriota bacterium]